MNSKPATADVSPKNSAASQARIGFHRPMIMSASARKPFDALMPRSNVLADWIERNAPARPASPPARVTLT